MQARSTTLNPYEPHPAPSRGLIWIPPSRRPGAQSLKTQYGTLHERFLGRDRVSQLSSVIIADPRSFMDCHDCFPCFSRSRLTAEKHVSPHPFAWYQWPVQAVVYMSQK